MNLAQLKMNMKSDKIFFEKLYSKVELWRYGNADGGHFSSHDAMMEEAEVVHHEDRGPVTLPLKYYYMRVEL